jgi:hypothetical protein
MSTLALVTSTSFHGDKKRTGIYSVLFRGLLKDAFQYRRYIGKVRREEKLLTLPGLELQPLSRPSRSQSLYRLRYPGSYIMIGEQLIEKNWKVTVLPYLYIWLSTRIYGSRVLCWTLATF